jgi:hypothetical protein
MSLRKRPTMTPALLAANRRNAQKSTGPRTEAGKRGVMLNGLKHGLRSRSFRNSLIKSGTDTVPVDRNFFFLTLYLRPQKRHEVHRIARFVQALWSVTRWGHRHEVRVTQPVRLLKNLITQCRLDSVLSATQDRMAALKGRPGIAPAKPECGSESITSSPASGVPSPREADLLRRTGPILLPGSNRKGLATRK